MLVIRLLWTVVKVCFSIALIIVKFALGFMGVFFLFFIISQSKR